MRHIPARFLNKIQINTANDCWLWEAHRQIGGYGVFRYDGKVRMAHRVSFTIFHGEFADNMDVLHKCDTPACVNPAHLFLGTHTDNMNDASKKKRLWQQKVTHCPRGHAYGETVPGKRRYCGECSRIRGLEYHYRNRARRNAGFRARYHAKKLKGAE